MCFTAWDPRRRSMGGENNNSLLGPALPFPLFFNPSSTRHCVFSLSLSRAATSCGKSCVWGQSPSRSHGGEQKGSSSSPSIVCCPSGARRWQGRRRRALPPAHLDEVALSHRCPPSDKTARQSCIKIYRRVQGKKRVSKGKPEPFLKLSWNSLI